MSTDKSAEREPCWARKLTPREVEVLKYIFQTILKTGKAPTTTEMQIALKKPDDYIIHTLDGLEKKDLLQRKRGTQEIVNIYPVSLTPTEHQLILENGKRLFAMCAEDALGMPIIFNRNAKIKSQCEMCKQEITIKIKDEKIAWASHVNIMIWHPERQIAPAAETCCPLVNFFCGKEHLEEWTREKHDLVGKVSETEQKFPKIRQSWKQYGKTLGLR